ncbi:MAG: DNA repair protein [Gammaproteobacteria bacterium]|nr:MAG: DNA repair protein [Gammaproteobacteria bacterium]
MGTETPFNLNDETGTYSILRPISANEILHQAELILEAQFRPGTKIQSPANTEKFLRSKLAHFEYEVFCAIYLTNRHSIIKFEKLFNGTVDRTSVYPREVVKKALQLNAAAVIIAHNHPSWEGEPSQADERITRRLKSALELVDIRTLDHIVVAGTNMVSMAASGLV